MLSLNIQLHLWHEQCNIIQLLPLCEGNMTICSPEAGNIAQGRSPREILPVEGEQIKSSYYPHTRATIVLFC